MGVRVEMKRKVVERNRAQRREQEAMRMANGTNLIRFNCPSEGIAWTQGIAELLRFYHPELDGAEGLQQVGWLLAEIADATSEAYEREASKQVRKKEA